MHVKSKSSRQIVTFYIQDGEYGIPIENMLEVVRMVAIINVPDAPTWLSGVINLRGRVVPVINLRLRLGLPDQTPGLNTPIVVVEANDRVVGLIADTMHEVTSVSADAIAPPDELTNHANSLEAICRIDDRLVLILNLLNLTAGIESIKVEGITHG